MGRTKAEDWLGLGAEPDCTCAEGLAWITSKQKYSESPLCHFLIKNTQLQQVGTLHDEG